MIDSIKIYLDTEPEDGLDKLLSEGSPLKFGKKTDDWYTLYCEGLDYFFVYGRSDQEKMEEPLHQQVKEALDIQARSELHYGCSIDTQEEAMVFRRILDHLMKHNISYYMVVTDKQEGEEHLIIGENVLTKTKAMGTEIEVITKILYE